MVPHVVAPLAIRDRAGRVWCWECAHDALTQITRPTAPAPKEQL